MKVVIFLLAFALFVLLEVSSDPVMNDAKGRGGAEFFGHLSAGM
jgi:hypothetical protein